METLGQQVGRKIEVTIEAFGTSAFSSHTRYGLLNAHKKPKAIKFLQKVPTRKQNKPQPAHYGRLVACIILQE